MSWINVSGLPFAAQDVSGATSGLLFNRTMTGRPMVAPKEKARQKGARSLTSAPLDSDTARFWFRLFRGEGSVWNFEDGDISSDRRKTVTAITPASSNPKFGTYHATRSGSNISIAAVPTDNFTVAYWYDSGAGYVHVLATRLPTDVADRIWVDGARNDAYSAPHSITAGVFTLATNGDYDDLVVLPYGMPTDLAGEFDRTVPFSRLPLLDVRGDGMPARVCEMIEKPSMSAVQALQTRFVVSVRVLEYQSAAFVPWTPAEISGSLFAWWDPSDDSAITVSAGRVTAIKDKSGNARNLTSFGSGLVLSAINGLGAIQGEEATSNILYYNAAPTAAVEIHTVADPQGDTTWLVGGCSLSTHYAAVAQVSASTTLSQNAGTPTYWADGVDLAPTTRQNLLIGWTGQHVIAVRGVTLSGWPNFRPFSYTSLALFAGVWGEYILTSAALSVADRQKLEGYLAHKWGMADNLAASHPYKQAPPRI